MTSNVTQDLLNNIVQFNTYPSSIIQHEMNTIEAILQGMDVVDPSNPFVLGIEANATAVCAFITASEAVVRKLYPLLATNTGDLHRHMSDKDYIGIDGTGATGTIKLLIPYQKLLDAAVYLNSTSVKTLIFPRDSQITVNGVKCIIGYPIVINIMAYDVIQVVYDTSLDNPLMPLTKNVLDNQVVIYNNLQYLEVTVPVSQYTVTSATFPVTASASFAQTVNYADTFALLRAYLPTGTGGWTEIATTQADIVYDVNKPTLKVVVNDGSLNVSLPDIYQTLGTAGSAIRLDVYTTRGPLNLDLSPLTSSSFSAKWQDFSVNALGAASAAIAKLNDIIYYSTSMLSGGSAALPLADRINRVIYRSNINRVPILPTDISIALSVPGYKVQKLIDTISNRVLAASKDLPPRLDNGITFTPLATNGQVTFNMKEGLPEGHYRASLITHISNRATVMPDTLYSYVDGNLSVLSDSQLTNLSALSKTDLCTVLNNGSYFYSPFHYIIDYTKQTLAGRVYYLQEPLVDSQRFIAANTYRNYSINTLQASISLLDGVYTLTVSTQIPTGLTGVHCQLSHYDAASKSRIFKDAVPTVLANMAVFVFNLSTSFDVTELDEIELSDMVNAVDHLSPMFVNILSTFDLVYYIEGSNVGLETNFDTLIHSAIPVIGATHETITLQFGQRLEGLYCPTRDVLAADGHLQYADDVYATYPNTVYQSGPVGWVYTQLPNGITEFVVEHNAGDFILDEHGNRILLHRKGDPILDNNGQVTLMANSTAGVLRLIGITLIDAKYKYATATAIAAYAKTLPAAIIGYLQNELAPIAARLEGRTALYYRPQGSPTTLEVVLGDGTHTYMSGVLSVKIKYYLTKQGMDSLDIQDRVRKITKGVISSYLSKATISLSAFTTELTGLLPPQVVGFEILQFFPNNAQLVTVVNAGTGFVIGEEITVQPDGSMGIMDLVDLTFDLAT